MSEQKIVDYEYKPGFKGMALTLVQIKQCSKVCIGARQ